MKVLIRTPSILAPVVVGVGLLGLMYGVTREGFARLTEANRVISVAQWRQSRLSDYLRLMVDAETGQRGFLLTGDEHYLTPYQAGVPQLQPLENELADNYIREYDLAGLKMIRTARSLSAAKINELESSIRLYRQGGLKSAMALVRTGVGVEAADEVRSLIEALRAREGRTVSAAIPSRARDLVLAQWFAGIVTALNVGLIVLSGILVARALRRRDVMVAELDLELAQRNSDLSDLSSHLQRVSEVEKAALSRELHDELGGLLIASKMDVVWLQRHLPEASADAALRLQRIAQMLDEGVNFKRRVTESLRPTLLDNMGLITALKWLLEETCHRAALQFQQQFPDVEPALTDEARIAVFRIVQEALTNIVKHAAARNVTLCVTTNAIEVSVSIRDDGRGMPHSAGRSRTHGLVNMRHRASTLGGRCEIKSTPGKGTVVMATIPLAR